MLRELVVDNFAGGGGASCGIEHALGYSPDIAINHDADAIRMHTVNHPKTRHYCEDVWEVDPVAACGGIPVGLAWFSPDCKHFSKAKGGKPVDRKVRGLADVVLKWARLVRPRVIILENVEEFQTWGPLGEDNRPIKDLAGTEFRRWWAELAGMGYAIEKRELRATDYGIPELPAAPTTRKRLFVIARCDGQPIVWPTATHGTTADVEPRRIAGECIDWSIPVPSIFGRKRPLAEATMRRIARGVFRYVLETADPFIVPVTHQGDSRVHGINEPLRTITGANRGELALAVPTMVQVSWGERPGQAPRVPGLEKPIGTIMADGNKHGLVCAFLAKHYGGNEGPGTALSRSLDTITCTDHHALVVSHISKLYGTSTGSHMRTPMPTITAEGGHLAEVRAFLIKYYGTSRDGQSANEPLDTITTKPRFGLVTIAGTDYAIVDIGMRMLAPRELFRGQGFPDSYIIDRDADGVPFTLTAQQKMCGNSVCPPLAAAIVRANYTSRPVYVSPDNFAAARVAA
jgi:DNA (cytosine-5)-methyltransferase 1